MTWLAGEVERSLAGPWGGTVERLVFGPTAGPDAIVATVDAACRASCGSPLDAGFLYTVSVGCVFGCQLSDGQRVVLKAYQPRWTVPFLEAVRRVQRHLQAGGFPCPEPVGDVVTIDGAVFVAERELPDPGARALGDELAPVSARGLAELVDRGRTLNEPALAQHPLRLPLVGVFPEPHSPIFDFAATAEGAEWIDELARRAIERCSHDGSSAVIAHTDWSARNVRIERDRVVAVYDWDSLALVPESEALGLAASTWSKTGEPGDATPTPAAIDAYIEAYAAGRGQPLEPVQRRAARAAAVRGMAYTARCEHAIDPDEQQWTTTRARLRADADALLA